MMILAAIYAPLFEQMLQQYPDLWGLLVTADRWRFLLDRPDLAHHIFAGDNDAFSENFNPTTFRNWLTRLQPYAHRFRFITAPDVVGDAPATLQRFHKWQPIMHSHHLPIAFVLQDGITIDTVPWHHIDAVFVGGTTTWKLSPAPLRILEEAARRGLWRHIGRVNSIVRYNHFRDFADSCDGTGITKYPNTYIHRLLPHMLASRHQLKLWSTTL